MVLEGLGNICYWKNPADWLSWEFSLEQAGRVRGRNDSTPVRRVPRAAPFEVTRRRAEARLPHRRGHGHLVRPQTAEAGQFEVSTSPGKQHARAEAATAGKPGRGRDEPRLAAADTRRTSTRPTIRRRSTTAAQCVGQVFVVPNFHPASCGWLTDFSTERNYCAYSYLDHLDRVRDDPNYAFAPVGGEQHHGHPGVRAGTDRGTEAADPRRPGRTGQRLLPGADDQPVRRRGPGEDGRRGAPLAAAGDGRAAAAGLG